MRKYNTVLNKLVDYINKNNKYLDVLNKKNYSFVPKKKK